MHPASRHVAEVAGCLRRRAAVPRSARTPRRASRSWADRSPSAALEPCHVRVPGATWRPPHHRACASASTTSRASAVTGTGVRPTRRRVRQAGPRQEGARSHRAPRGAAGAGPTCGSLRIPAATCKRPVATPAGASSIAITLGTGRIRRKRSSSLSVPFGHALPQLRRQVDRDLRRHGVPRERVIAAVVELLDRTLIRVGNEEYARANGSFGLTTLRNRHVRVEGSHLRMQLRGQEQQAVRRRASTTPASPGSSRVARTFPVSCCSST